MDDAETSDAFTPLERLVLRYAEALTATPAHVPETLFMALQANFDEAQLVELTAAISWENQRARFNRGFDIQAQNFSEGQFCPLPRPADQEGDADRKLETEDRRRETG